MSLLPAYPAQRMPQSPGLDPKKGAMKSSEIFHTSQQVGYLPELTQPCCRESCSDVTEWRTREEKDTVK